MNVVELHPEELIDRLADGTLSRADRERLDAHLAQCPSCRFEMGVRTDFEEERSFEQQRPQLGFTSKPSQEGALHASLEAKPMSLRARRRRRWPLLLVAASFVLCAGGAAAAAVLTGAVSAPAWLGVLAKAPPSAPAANNAKVASKALRVTKPVVKSAAVTPAPPELLPSELSPPEPAHVAASLGGPEATTAVASRPNQLGLSLAQHVARLRVEPAQRRAVSGSDTAPPVAAFDSSPPVTVPASPSTPKSLPEPAAPVDPAASLFSEANRARRDGNVDRAVALYHALQTRFPSSAESALSRALLAQLLLDRGDPEAALLGFDRYLSEGAPVLSAEALVGRARALEQLGRPARAASAWKEVQSRFPGSVHARLAAARLAALGMR